MLVFADNTFVTCNDFPDTDWTENIDGAPKPEYVIDDNSDFARIIMQNYPNIKITGENGVITAVDVTEPVVVDVITQDDINVDFDYRLSCLELGL